MRVLLRDGERVIELDTQGQQQSGIDVIAASRRLADLAQSIWREMGWPMPARTERDIDEKRQPAQVPYERRPTRPDGSPLGYLPVRRGTEDPDKTMQIDTSALRDVR